jgi:N-acetylglucosamine kinase-like BadF-type ATPase
MNLFLGVDAGGTGTRALLVNSAGAILGRGQAGPGNWQAVGISTAGATLRSAINDALNSAGVQAENVNGAFLALAGVRTAADRALIATELTPLQLGGTVLLGGDLEAAHAGAHACSPGIVVIAGTGSAAWGRDMHDRTASAGGWGWLVDDRGGGYWLALRALSAACEAADGRGPATTLGARAVAFFGTADLRETLTALHAGRRDRAGIAAFAREVRAAADSGDTVALNLVAQAAHELLRLARAVRDQLPGYASATTPCPLAIVGGLGLGAHVAAPARAAGFAPVEPWGEPVLGAALLASRAAGAKLDATARNALLHAWKPTV